MKKSIIALLMGATLLGGCCGWAFNVGYDIAAPDTVTPMLDDIVDTAFRKGDLEMVHRAVPAAVIIAEGLANKTPDDARLLTLLSMLYFAYAYAFAEGSDDQWANELYLRGRNYGMQALMLDDDFAEVAGREKPDWRAAAAELDEDYVGPLFWTAINIGMYVNKNKREPRALLDLPVVLAFMDRVIELDETYFYGGAHLFYGAYYAGLPAMAGGGAAKSKAEFDKAFEIGEQKLLLVHLFYARYYATLLRDEQLFKETLEKIIAAPDDLLPPMTLINKVAKMKAREMLKNPDKYIYGSVR